MDKHHGHAPAAADDCRPVARGIHIVEPILSRVPVRHELHHQLCPVHDGLQFRLVAGRPADPVPRLAQVVVDVRLHHHRPRAYLLRVQQHLHPLHPVPPVGGEVLRRVVQCPLRRVHLYPGGEELHPRRYHDDFLVVTPRRDHLRRHFRHLDCQVVFPVMRIALRGGTVARRQRLPLRLNSQISCRRYPLRDITRCRRVTLLQFHARHVKFIPRIFTAIRHNTNTRVILVCRERH